jgi:hypothetical protein
LLSFLVFLCGLSAFFRTRSEGATAPRVLLVVTILVLLIGPWIAMAIAGVVTHSSDDAMALAAPSPTYAFVLAEAIQHSAPNLSSLLLPGIVCAAGYALFGVGFLAMAAGRAHTRLGKEGERLTQLEAMLDAELRAEGAAVSGAEASPLEDAAPP